MNRPRIWWRLVRGPNLLIVALTQYLLQYLILVPVFRRAALPAALQGGHFALFVLVTVGIAAGGYLINDLEDQAIDARNKPDSYIVGRLLAPRLVWRVYAALFIFGSLLSVYLAWYVANLPLALIFPAAYGLLYAYSRRLKKMPFWGNLTVAVYCAVVPGILLVAERLSLRALNEQAPELATQVLALFGAYLGFAFLTTLWREMIKDVEDIAGDRAEGCRTLPIVIGIPATKCWIGLVAVIQIALLLTSLLLIQNFLFSKIALLLLAVMPSLWLALQSSRASTKAAFHRVSQQLKLLMLVGLLLLFLAAWEMG